MLGLRIAAVIGLTFLAGAAVAQKNTGGTGGQGTGAAPAGGVVSAADPQSVVSSIQAQGYTATLGTDALGDPMVSSEISGLSYNIYFYGCDDAHANCLWLLFYAGLDLPNGWNQESVMQWHNDQIVGAVTLDEEMDPFLSYFVTTVGGLNQENFTDVVTQWGYALDALKTKTGFQ
jgi:hypothetical protein